ncbi:MAG TPA: DUF3515 domain-containing protein [Pseudonocardiaceae bacterium]
MPDQPPGQPPERPAGQRADRQPDRRAAASRPLIVALVVVGILVVGLAVAGIVTRGMSGSAGSGGSTASGAPNPSATSTGPVGLAPVAAPQANSPSCTALLTALPAALPNGGTTLPRRSLLAPAPRAAAAWGDSANPVVLRCGIEQPPEFTATSEVLAVDGVSWFQVSSSGAATWYCVDRPVTVALTLPSVVGGTGPIQAISETISKALPAVPVHPGG